MKKFTLLVLGFVTLLSVFSFSASAFFESMTPEEMKTELNSKNDPSEMAFAWGFEDAPAEYKEYQNDIPERLEELLKDKWYSYTAEPSDVTEKRGIKNLLSVGRLSRKNSVRAAEIFEFSDEASALSFYESGKAIAEYSSRLSVYVVSGDERTVNMIVKTEVEAAVKNTSCDSASGYNIIGGAFSSVNKDSAAGIQFRTPDSAIRLESGELILGKAQKDYTEESYISTDAYMDVYVTGVDYDKAHSETAGKDFVLSASLRAPYSDNISKSTVEVFRTRSSFAGKDGKVTIDSTLTAYNSATREIIVYSDGKTVKTGIYLSDYDHTAVAVHVHPRENTFDFYADGILVVKGATFLTDAKRAQIAPGTGKAPSGDGADYTLTRLRLFYSGIRALTGDVVCIDNFAWYYSDEYLERSLHPQTMVAVSADIKERVYLNFYLNFSVATLNDYSASISFTVGRTEKQEVYLISGTPVNGGEYDGLIKYSVALGFCELGKEISISLNSSEHSLYFYSQNNTGEFCGNSLYKTSAEKYFKELSDDKNGFDVKTVNLARAVLNLGAAIQKHEDPKISESLLPNKGVEYSAEELSSVTSELVREAIDSNVHKMNAYFGMIPHFAVSSYSFSFDEGGLYLTIGYIYTGTRDITVNGSAVEKDGFGNYRYKIYIEHILLIDDVFTITFTDGVRIGFAKLSVFHIAAGIIDSPEAKSHALELASALYLYASAGEAYFN